VFKGENESLEGEPVEEIVKPKVVKITLKKKSPKRPKERKVVKKSKSSSPPTKKVSTSNID